MLDCRLESDVLGNVDGVETEVVNNEGESKLASVIGVLVLLEVGSTGVGSDDVL